MKQLERKFIDYLDEIVSRNGTECKDMRRKKGRKYMDLYQTLPGLPS